MISFRSTVRQGGIVIGGVAIATLLRLALDPILHDRGLFLLAAMAVAFTAHLCGFWAGIATTALSIPATAFLFRSLSGAGRFATPEWTQIALFTALAIPLSIIGGRLRAIVTDLEEALRRERHLHDSERAARSEADHASRVKDEFLAVLSHELKTPLNAMVGWTHVLKGMALPPDASRAVETILRNADRQMKLMSHIDDMARVTTGKLVLEASRVDIGLLLEQAVDAVRLAAGARRIRLQLLAPEPSLAVRGDPDRLQQVFWNLLTNAIKFSPAGALVQMTATRDADNGVVIKVTDDGQGISPEFLPHVFDSFRQEDPSKRRRQPGLGLGLSIVKHLVEAHGGTVQAESGGSGTGATFTVTLPVALEADVVEASTDLLEGLRILIVEDHADTLALLTRSLHDLGAVVVPVTSAAEARSEISRRAPDVIVSDVGMPEEDGLTFIRSVRRRPEQRHIPAIALTAYASAADRAEALSAGFQEHVAKPAHPHQIARVIARLRLPDSRA